jgi:hypothetical protein
VLNKETADLGRHFIHREFDEAKRKMHSGMLLKERGNIFSSNLYPVSDYQKEKAPPRQISRDSIDESLFD